MRERAQGVVYIGTVFLSSFFAYFPLVFPLPDHTMDPDQTRTGRDRTPQPGSADEVLPDCTTAINGRAPFPSRWRRSLCLCDCGVCLCACVCLSPYACSWSRVSHKVSPFSNEPKGPTSWSLNVELVCACKVPNDGYLTVWNLRIIDACCRCCAMHAPYIIILRIRIVLPCVIFLGTMEVSVQPSYMKTSLPFDCLTSDNSFPQSQPLARTYGTPSQQFSSRLTTTSPVLY